MRFHVIWRKIQFYWKRRAVRAVVALLVMVGVIFMEYKLAHIPLPVEIENSNKVTIPPIRFGQEMVVEGPLLDTATGLLLEHEGTSTEIVNVYLDNARLAKETAAELTIDPRAASISGAISYTTREGEQKRPPVNSRACSTTIEVSPATQNKLPGKLHFFQTSPPGSDNYRDLEVRADGADLLIRLSTNPPAAPDNADEEIGEDDGPGCLKRVAGAQWKQEMAGAFIVKCLVAADSKFNLRFLPITRDNPLWESQSGVLEPFMLGLSGLAARAVSIRTPEGTPLLEVRGADEKNLLRINSLKVGSNHLQVGMTGKAFVKVEGEDISVDLFERIQKYPFLAGLLLAANGALLAWFIRLVRSILPGWS